jgi:hypothetical protein
VKQELKQLQDQSDPDTEEIVSFSGIVNKVCWAFSNAFASNIFSFFVDVLAL